MNGIASSIFFCLISRSVSYSSDIRFFSFRYGEIAVPFPENANYEIERLSQRVYELEDELNQIWARTAAQLMPTDFIPVYKWIFLFINIFSLYSLLYYTITLLFFFFFLFLSI